MNFSRTIVSVVAATVLSAAIAGPALAAAPTFSGTLLCTDSFSGEQRVLNPLDHATKKDIAVW
jgi:hypothetical protein